MVLIVVDEPLNSRPCKEQVAVPPIIGLAISGIFTRIVGGGGSGSPIDFRPRVPSHTPAPLPSAVSFFMICICFVSFSLRLMLLHGSS